MPRNTQDTLAWLRGQSVHETQDWYRMCLSLVRQARGLPGVYPSAIKAWEGAKKKHPLNSGSNFSAVPIGAPIFYHSSTYGHIVTFAGVTSNGPLCWTNDVAGRGEVSLVSPLFFISNWRQPILGWTEDLNGIDIPDLSRPSPIAPQPPNTVSLSAAQAAAKADPSKVGKGRTPGSGDDVQRIERALVSKGLLNAQYVDGHYGTVTRAAYKRWQQKLGYEGKQADGIPGIVSLRRLSEGQSWRVIK